MPAGFYRSAFFMSVQSLQIMNITTESLTKSEMIAALGGPVDQSFLFNPRIEVATPIAKIEGLVPLTFAEFRYALARLSVKASLPRFKTIRIDRVDGNYFLTDLLGVTITMQDIAI